MKEIKIQKTILLYESQIPIIQAHADKLFEGNFGRVMRTITAKWIDENKALIDEE